MYKVDINTVLGLTSFDQRPGRILADPKLRAALIEAVNNAATNLPGYDPAAAKRLLDSDGWKVGPGGIRQENGKRPRRTSVRQH